MLFSYNDILKKYGNDYQINKALQKKDIIKIQPGVYSDTEDVSELNVISFVYPTAIFTMDSAFYYHGLTDTIPEKYHLATERDASKITSSEIKQYFYNKKNFETGKTTMLYQNSTVCIYDMERLLIELILSKKKLPFDYYKELINSYRHRIYSLDVQKIQLYSEYFRSTEKIMEAILTEVY